MNKKSNLQRRHKLVRAILAQAEAISTAAQEFALDAEHDYEAAFCRYKTAEFAAYGIYLDVLVGKLPAEKLVEDKCFARQSKKRLANHVAVKEAGEGKVASGRGAQ